MIRSILDGSAAAEHALPLSRLLARGLSAKVELLSVIDLVELSHNVSTAENLFLDTLAQEEARRREEYLARVVQSFAGAAAHYHMGRGKAENVISESAAAKRECLIVMATHGRSGLNRWLLGSVAEKILRGTVNPLLLVRSKEAIATEEESLKSIVVPLDGSALAETILPTVVDFAQKLDLEVVLFRVFHIPYGVYDGGGSSAIDLERLVIGIEAGVREYLEEKRAALQTAGLERVSIASRQGIAADEIIDFSCKRPEALIAMGSHGRSGLKRWVLGSVAETVARHAANPVLIFRATG